MFNVHNSLFLRLIGKKYSLWAMLLDPYAMSGFILALNMISGFDMNIEYKKQLKLHYKESSPVMGIYLISNEVTGKRLLGSSLNVSGVFNRIKFSLNHNSSTGRIASLLLKDWQQYGGDAFRFEIIDVLEATADGAACYKEDLMELLDLWREKIENCDYK